PLRSLARSQGKAPRQSATAPPAAATFCRASFSRGCPHCIVGWGIGLARLDPSITMPPGEPQREAEPPQTHYERGHGERQLVRGGQQILGIKPSEFSCNPRCDKTPEQEGPDGTDDDDG